LKTKNLLTTLAVLLCSNLTFAQHGNLDSTFDPGTGANNYVATTSIQSDGKIIIAGDFTSYNGTARNRVARLNADGSLDTSFNTGTGVNGQIRSTSIQSDGKIIIGGAFTSVNGTARNRIARLNTDGSLDISFDPGTGANNNVTTISIQNDGKIIIGGLFTSYNGTGRNRIMRLNTNGSLDNSFNPGTGASDYVLTSSIQSDGKIIIGGFFISYNNIVINCIARLNIDGSLDNSFNTGTGVEGSDPKIFATTILNNGQIIIGGKFSTINGTPKINIAILNSNGSLDTSFDPGSGTDDYPYTFSVQNDGKIIIGGYFSTYNGTARSRIVRVNVDGSLDTSFNPGTGASSVISTISAQSDGKIIICGSFTSYNGTTRNHIARLFASNPLTSVQNYKEKESHFTLFPNPFSTQTTIQSDHFIQNGSLTIYNSLGEVVSQINNINGQSVIIERGYLANGLYFIRLTEGSHEMMLKKVIVVD